MRRCFRLRTAATSVMIYTDPLGVHIVGAAHGQGTMDCKRMIDMIREKSPMDKIIMENEIAFLSKDEMIFYNN